MSDLKILAYSKLTKEKFSEVRRLAALCKKADGFDPFFYWESIKRRKNPGINEILCYSGDTLVGYLALYYFEAKEVEITVMTHPEYRNLAIYAVLWECAKRVISEYPVQISRTVFTCNQENILQKEYLKRLGATGFLSTFKLALPTKKYAPVSVRKDASVSVRTATPEDIGDLQQLESDCFLMSPEFYQNYLLTTIEDPNQKIMVAVQKKRIIGKIHIQYDKKNAFLYGFCIAPEEQKKGYGGMLLNHVILALQQESIHKILLDVVDAEDLQWYKRFQFKAHATYEHWKLPIYVNPVKEREKQLETMILNFQSLPLQAQLTEATYTKH